MSTSDRDAGRAEVDLLLACDQSDQDRQDWRDLQVAVHGAPGQRDPGPAARLTWAPVDPHATWVVRVRFDGRLVSYLWIIQRTIRVNGSRVQAAGIRGVMTHPAYRRRGFARSAMVRAAEFIWQELRPDLALLLSSVMAVPLHSALGWQTIVGPVLCEQPGGTMSYTDVIPEAPAMVLVPPWGQLPEGIVDLRGLPW